MRLSDSSVETVAGCGARASWDGPALAAAFAFPYGLAWDPASDTLVLSEWDAHRIRRVCPTSGQVWTIAGSGERGWRDGTGATAAFNEPCLLAVGESGMLLVADSRNAAVRCVSFPDGPLPPLDSSQRARRDLRDRAHVATLAGSPYRPLSADRAPTPPRGPSRRDS